MKKPAIVYVYRGPVERGAKYAWRNGYSETSPEGRPYYPWMTYRECQRDAKLRGAKAVFQ